MSNQKMTLQGFAWERPVKDSKGELSRKLSAIDCEMPYSDTEHHVGMPVTIEAFKGMLEKFKDEAGTGSILKDILYISFSKASLFRILAQESCEQIAFFFAIPQDDKKVSLALLGLKGNGSAVKGPAIRKVLESTTFDDTNITYPAMEEKGNSGTKPPLDDVVSLREQFEKYLALVERDNINLADFIDKYVMPLK